MVSLCVFLAVADRHCGRPKAELDPSLLSPFSLSLSLILNLEDK